MTESHVSIGTEKQAVEPPLYHVIFLNDSITTFDFVISTLMIYFGYTPERAEDIAHYIHTTGSSVVATLAYGIAEQRAFQVKMAAEAEGFPLQIQLRAER